MSRIEEKNFFLEIWIKWLNIVETILDNAFTEIPAIEVTPGIFPFFKIPKLVFFGLNSEISTNRPKKLEIIYAKAFAEKLC